MTIKLGYSKINKNLFVAEHRARKTRRRQAQALCFHFVIMIINYYYYFFQKFSSTKYNLTKASLATKTKRNNKKKTLRKKSKSTQLYNRDRHGWVV